MPSSRQLAAIMFTDIVGYTALMGSDEEKAFHILERNRQLHKPLIDKHRGKLLKEIGDGILASFNSALDAIKCAKEIQSRLQEDDGFQLRIGIHLGDVTFQQSDVFGDGVNVASRIQSIAHSGGIYFSESVDKAVRGRKDLESQYVGELALKNENYSIRIYALKDQSLPAPDFNVRPNIGRYFWEEVRRRNVMRPALVYICLALLLGFFGRVYILNNGLPEYYITLMWSFLGLGLLVSVVLAWLFERSPQGFIRTTGKKSWHNPFANSQKKPLTSNLIIVILLISLAAIYSFPRTFGLSLLNSKPKDNSIAVLYFENMSGDKDQEYFSDGITMEIIAHLSRIEGFRITSSTSVLPYKGKGMNIREVARALNVGAVLEGSVRRSDDRVRINAQLVDTRADELLWAEVYDREMKDIFEIQSSVAHAIAGKFNLQITNEVEKSINTPPTQNLTAYDLYLQALAISNKLTGFGIGTYTGTGLEAINLLNLALTYDPNYAQAMALLSTNYFNVGSRLQDEAAIIMIDSAIYMAKEAVINYPDDAAGYVALGQVQSYKAKTLDEQLIALKWFHKAYEIDPVNSLTQLGTAYVLSGNYTEAIKYYSEKIDRDPQNHTGYVFKARVYSSLGQADSANKYLGIAENLVPNSSEISQARIFFHQLRGEPEAMEPYARAYYGQDTLGFYKDMGIAYMFRKDWEVAEKYYRKTNYRDMDWGLVLMHTGKPDSGRVALENAMAFRDRMLQPWTGDYARIHAILGNQEKAIHYARKLIDEGVPYYYISNDPFFDAIRHLPEFQEIEAEFYRKIREMLADIKRKAY